MIASRLAAHVRDRGAATGRQTKFSSDILYDTLRKHDPDHLLLRITRQEALKGLVDFGRIDHAALARVSPLAAPMLLEVGKVPVRGAGAARLMAETSARLMAAAGLG